MEPKETAVIVAPQVALATSNAGLPTPQEFDGIERMSAWIARARMFPQYDSVEKVFTALLYVRDLGVDLVPGMSAGHFINGKFGISTEMKLESVRVKNSGFELEVLEHTDDFCKVRARLDRSRGWQEGEFSLEDAKRAGLAGKDVWKNYARDMLLWRAVSRALRVTGGMYARLPQLLRDESLAPESEGAALVADAVVVEGEAERQPEDLGGSAPTGPSQPPSTAPVDVAELKRDCMRIMRANGYAQPAKALDLVNLILKEDHGLLPVRSASEVGPQDWTRVHASLLKRVRENGWKGPIEQAAVAAQGGPIPPETAAPSPAQPGSESALSHSDPFAVPIEDMQAEPGLLLAFLLAAQSKLALGLVQESPHGSGDWFFVHAGIIKACGGRIEEAPMLATETEDFKQYVVSEAMVAMICRGVQDLLSEPAKSRRLPARAKVAAEEARGA